MENNETEFTANLKKFVSNRAVIITAVTLLVATGIIVAITVSANRSKTPTPTVTDTTPVTDAATEPAIKDETLPTYNDAETKPVATTPDAEEATFALPVTGKLQKGHDTTIQVYSNTMGDYRVHLGLDIATDPEAPVYAAADGEVAEVWYDALMGQCVSIRHEDDTMSIYKNLSKTLAKGITVGAEVQRGQEIGSVGDTAAIEMADEPHLHFEMTVADKPVDPLAYFSDSSVATLTTPAETTAGK